MVPSGRCVPAVLIGLSFLCGYQSAPARAEEQPASKIVAPGTHVFQVSVNGVNRRYVIHVPPSYNHAKQWPIVVVFHGGGGTAKAVMRETGWAEKADEGNFLSVFPEGSSPNPSRPARFRDNPQTWNDGSGRFNVGAAERKVDDIGFVRALPVDSQRIFVTGFSNGASMTFKIGRELADRVAAIAPVAGADWAADSPNLARPISLLYITGTADPLNPIDGGVVKIGPKTYGTKPPTREMIQR
jgi:polyhydroxybutyrate depolymerase